MAEEAVALEKELREQAAAASAQNVAEVASWIADWREKTVADAIADAEDFESAQRKILASISELEEKALAIQVDTSLEETQKKVLSRVTSFERKALELQYSLSAAEKRRKLLQDISSLEERALALQLAKSEAELQPETQRKLLQEVSALDRRALKLQLSTSARERQKRMLSDIQSLERKALETQFSRASAVTPAVTESPKQHEEKGQTGQKGEAPALPFLAQYLKNVAWTWAEVIKAQRSMLKFFEKVWTMVVLPILNFVKSIWTTDQNQNQNQKPSYKS